MATEDRTETAGHRALQTAHLVVAALLAVVIAAASQDWSAFNRSCATAGECDPALRPDAAAR